MKTLAVTLSLAGAALLAGCASPASGPSGADSASRADASAYAWNDPFFYQPWYDPSAIVLPPPLPGASSSGVRAGPAGADSAGLREVDYR